MPTIVKRCAEPKELADEEQANANLSQPDCCSASKRRESAVVIRARTQVTGSAIESTILLPSSMNATASPIRAFALVDAGIV